MRQGKADSDCLGKDRHSVRLIPDRQALLLLPFSRWLPCSLGNFWRNSHGKTSGFSLGFENRDTLPRDFCRHRALLKLEG
jgi:hypothetical protein